MQVLSWALLMVALHQVYVFLSITLAERDVDLWFFFSSDTVQYGLLYRDLFQLGFHYAGWNISHAPEYLQMVWALLLDTFAPTLEAGHVLEAMAQPVLLALALQRFLSKTLGPVFPGVFNRSTATSHPWCDASTRWPGNTTCTG